MKKKILIVETNVKKYEKFDIPTGLWLGELTEFYDEIKKAGYEADFVSPKGGYVNIDPFSMKFIKKEDLKYFRDEDFKNRAIKNTKSPCQINPNDYICIYYTGGHGVIFDYPDDKGLKNIAEDIYKNGGYIASVCHGVVGLLNLRDENGEYLIKGKNITGFTNTEEKLILKSKKIPFLAEDEIKKRGAKYRKKRFFKSFAIKDGRIITGQNPYSSRKVASLLLNSLRGEIK